MGRLFVTEGLVDASITAIDSTLIKTKGPVWHKSSMEKGEVPRPGIDTDARWGYSHTKGWVFRIQTTFNMYNNRQDYSTSNCRCNYCKCYRTNKMYVPLTSPSSSSSSSLVFSLPSSLYMVADPGYDDKNLYEYSKKVLEIDLLCPVERYKNTSKKRLEIVCFYQSVLVRLSTAEGEYR